MSFKDLYLARQQLGRYISRNEIIALTQRFTPQEIVVFMTGRITPEVVRGFYLSPTDGPGTPEWLRNKHAIGVARENNRCWQRMVIAKECMHIFDTGLELTSTSDDVETLLEELLVSSPKPQVAAQVISERRAVWMALSLFCREDDRIDYSRKLSNGLTTADVVAEEVRMPLQYVPYLFGDKYKRLIEIILTLG